MVRIQLLFLVVSGFVLSEAFVPHSRGFVTAAISARTKSATNDLVVLFAAKKKRRRRISAPIDNESSTDVDTSSDPVESPKVDATPASSVTTPTPSVEPDPLADTVDLEEEIDLNTISEVAKFSFDGVIDRPKGELHRTSATLLR